jgi:hypothetical protein
MIMRGFWSHLSLAGSPAASQSSALQSIDLCVSIIFNFCHFFLSLCLCFFLIFIVLILRGARGGAVVEALRYKPEARGIDSRLFHWNFSLTKSLRPHYGPGVDSTSNRNEYQKYFLGVKVASA